MKTTMMKLSLALLCLTGAALAQAGPQIPLSGSIGVPGSAPTLCSAAVVMPSDANFTLTANQFACNSLYVTSSASLTATRNIVAPLNYGQQFTVTNATTGGQSIQLIGASGTGVTIASGQTQVVNSPNGTNYVATASTGGSGLPSATQSGQIISSTAAGTTYAVQGQTFYSQASDTVASIESKCSSLCTYVVTVPQTITLGASHALSSNVQLNFQAGGQWTVNGAFTLTIPGNVDGTLNQHFAGSSTIVFGNSQAIVPVEWFGAIGDWNGSTGTNNTTSIQSCLNSLTSGQCLLQAKSYLITSALTITKSSTGIAGTASANIANATIQKPSQLVINSASADAIDVGTFHGTYIQLNRFSNFGIQRTVLPTGTASGMALNDVGLYTIEGVGAFENVRGFYFLGGYNGEVKNSEAAIGNVSTYTTPAYGFYVDSDSTSAQSSIHLTADIAVDLVASGQFVGMELHGSQINDTDVDFLNITGDNYGLRIDQTGACPALGAYDIIFNTLTIDSGLTDSVFISNTCAAGDRVGILFNGGFLGGFGSIGVGGIDIESSSGITFSGTQITAPVLVHNSNVVNFTGVQFYTGASLTYSNSNNSIVGNNTFRGPASSAPATYVVLAGSTNNSIIGNALSGFATNGITLDSTSNDNILSNNAIDATHIPTAVVDGGNRNGAYAYSYNFAGFHHARAFGTPSAPAAILFNDSTDGNYPLILRADNVGQNQGTDIPSGASYQWSSAADGAAVGDTGISRIAAGEVAMGTATPGDRTGQLDIAALKIGSAAALGSVQGTGTKILSATGTVPAGNLYGSDGTGAATDSGVSPGTLASVVANNTWTGTNSYINTVAHSTITAATSGANRSSPVVQAGANYWNGSASTSCQLSWQLNPAAGTNPVHTYSLSQSGCPSPVLTQLPTLGTIGNCSSSASPAVCGSSAAGSVVIAATASSVTVNTTAVTANSQILITPDDSLGTKLGVTCNSTLVTVLSSFGITARTAGTSFTISTSSTPTANPACFSYSIIN